MTEFSELRKELRKVSIEKLFDEFETANMHINCAYSLERWDYFWDYLNYSIQIANVIKAKPTKEKYSFYKKLKERRKLAFMLNDEEAMRDSFLLIKFFEKEFF